MSNPQHSTGQHWTLNGQLPPLNLGLTGPEFVSLNLEQYIGLWAVDEAAFLQQLEAVRMMDLRAHVLQNQQAQNSAPVPSAAARSAADLRDKGGGLVQIDIRGTMTKQGSSLSSAGSTVRIRQAVRQAMNDPEVSGVLFVIDSPGGTVAGTAELASEIRKLSEVKPTVTLAEDLMASAALYVGVQSRKVFANVESASVGSMGVFIGLYDYSGMAAKEGIRPVVIKTGELKAAGFPGTEISDAQKSMWQSLADESFRSFAAAVRQGRPAITEDQMKEISRAGTYHARQAADLNLIDGIRSYDAAVAELRAMVTPKRKGAGATMTERTAASLLELRAACDGATSDFLLGQLDRNATLDEARVEWTRQLNTQLLGLQGEVTKLKGQLTTAESAAATAKTEHDKIVADLNAKVADLEGKLKARNPILPVGSTGSGAGTNPDSSATAQWNAAVAAEVATGAAKQVAMGRVRTKQPELHKAYLEEVNSQRS